MKLYSFPLSGHSHRVRLFLSLLGIEYALVDLDLAGGEHKAPEFLSLNPFGQVPVLDDGGTLISDSNAILVYLAKRHGADWLPEDPAGAAAVQRWLSVAAGEVAFGPAAARALVLFKRPGDAAELIARAHRLLAVMDAELASRPWIAGPAHTIADIALYSYISSAPEGNVDLAGYANVLAWLARVEALPGFVPMIVSPVGLAA
jgi:glutathione S-transferase